MPLLEFPRRPSAIASARSGLTGLALLSVRHWAPTWGLLFTLGFHSGIRVAKLFPEIPALPPFAGFTWLACLFPLGLVRTSGPGRVGLLWSALFVLASVQGQAAGRAMERREVCRFPQPWSPALVRQWEGPALLRITSWPELRSEGTWKAAARLVAFPTAEGPASPRRGQGVQLRATGGVPAPGDLLFGSLVLRVPPSGDLPGMFSERTFLAGRHLQWNGQMAPGDSLQITPPPLRAVRDGLAAFRDHLARRLGELLPGPEGDLAAAILLGRRSAGSRESARPFASLGLSHLFAVSGLHVGVLLALVLLPASALALSPTSRWWLLALFLPPYALLTGLPGSVVRAAGLVLLATLGRVLGRTVDPLHLLGLLFWANLQWEPAQVLDTGVLLSYGAVGGILLWPRVRGEALSNLVSRGQQLTDAFQVSLSAQWATLPVVAASFGRISLFSPLANLVAIPLFALAVWATVGGLLLPGWSGEGLATWAWLIFRSLSGAVLWLQDTPGGASLGLPDPGPIQLLAWLLVSLLLAFILSRTRLGSHRFRASLVAGLALLSVVGLYSLSPYRLPFASSPRVWQFDVGQGDAALVQFPDGWRGWIDTGGCWQTSTGRDQGPMQRDLLPWLERHGITSFSAVLLSHNHLDHTGGFRFLPDDEATMQFFGAGGSGPPGLDVKLEGKLIHRWKDWHLEILYPPRNLPEGWNENDHSMVVALRLRDRIRYLWTGDLEARGEGILVDSGKDLQVEVWKAGHHGSRTSGTPAFLEAARPRLVVISCGAGNRYRHPSHGPYTVESDTLRILRTDRRGSIEFTWNRRGEGRWRRGGSRWQGVP